MSPNAGITLLLGPPNSGKLARVIDWWHERRHDQPLMVVPAQADVSLISLELIHRAGTIFGPLPVTTFRGLVAEVLGHPLAIPGEAARRMVLARLLKQTFLEAIAPLAPLPGTAPALAALLRELDESGHDHGQVQMGLEAWGRAGGGALALDIARLHGAYSLVTDDEERASVGTWTGRASGSLSAWTRPLACYGFTSFTPIQRRLLDEAARHVPVLLALPYEEGSPLQELVAEEVEHWTRPGVVREMAPRQDRVFSSPALAYLEASLNQPGAGTSGSISGVQHMEGDYSGVRFLLASGRRNETELAAREVVRLLRAGFKPGEIALLVRHVTPWRSYLSQVLTAYGVPHRIDARIAWGRTGLGHALLQGVRGLVEADGNQLLSYLRSPYGGSSPEKVDAAEVRLHLRGGIRGERARAALLLAFPGETARLHDIARLSGKAVSGQPPTSIPALLNSAAEDMLHRAAQAGVLGQTRLEEDVRALSVLQRLGPELEAELPGLAGLAALELLLIALEQAPVSLGREDEAGVVHVLSVDRARPRRFPVVFLLGLVDGEFPGEDRAPDLLGPDQRRAANLAAGMALFKEVGPSRDEALFSLALSRPWQLLFLSARDGEDEGADATPSPFWERTWELLGRPRPLTRDLGEITHPLEHSPSRREFQRAQAAAGANTGGQPSAAWAHQLSAWRRPAQLTLPSVLAELAGRRVFSAGQLERYSQCPFAWFIESAVGLEDLEQELDALRVGSLVHEVLARVYEGLLTAGLLPLQPAHMTKAQELLEEHLERAISALSYFGSEAERRLARQEAGTQLRSFLELDASSESRLMPRWIEKRFGGREGVDIGGLRLRGRMDRVDAHHGGEGLVVIDYKSGSAVFGPRFATEGALQIPLYMLALRALHPGSPVLGGYYASLATGERAGMALESSADLLGSWAVKTSRVDKERFEAELEAVLERARLAAAGIRAGRIAASPEGSCPRYCDLRPLCRGPERQAAGLEQPPMAEVAPPTEPVQLSLLGESAS